MLREASVLTKQYQLIKHWEMWLRIEMTELTKGNMRQRWIKPL